MKKEIICRKFPPAVISKNLDFSSTLNRLEQNIDYSVHEANFIPPPHREVNTKHVSSPPFLRKMNK